LAVHDVPEDADDGDDDEDNGDDRGDPARGVAAELEALEARREKTRALKGAMMQELLTGRTRLV
jgi:hypothetical protein